MMKTTLTALVAACALLPAAAHAQVRNGSESRTYATLGYTSVDSEQAGLGAVTGRFGYKVLPWVGVELEAGVGVDDEAFDVSINGSGVIDLKHDVAAYAVAFLPLSDHFEAHARIGYGTTRIESSVAAVSVRGDDESFNYGVGASAFLDGWNGMRVDWTRREFQDDGGGADTWSVSYVRQF